MPNDARPLVLVTGIAGDVGGAVTNALKSHYRLVGMDREDGGGGVPVINADFTNDRSVEQAFHEFREMHGGHIASVVHLAAFYDFTGADDPLYHSLNVEGTRRLVKELQRFRVEQLVYAGTMLVHAPVKPGERIDENRRLDPQWAYPKSKAAAEQVIREHHGAIPYVLLHLAGLYDDEVLAPTLAHQAAGVYERSFESHVYPANLETGQSMVHKQDLAAAFKATIDRRDHLPREITILIGEPDPLGYGELQDRLGELIHGTEWTTIRIPSDAAAAGAWVQDRVMPHLPESLGGGKPFIRPFMAMDAGDHYALDITRAHELLGWYPKHHLDDTLPIVVAALKKDPAGWYKKNKIGWPPPDEKG